MTILPDLLPKIYVEYFFCSIQKGFLFKKHDYDIKRQGGSLNATKPFPFSKVLTLGFGFFFSLLSATLLSYLLKTKSHVGTLYSISVQM